MASGSPPKPWEKAGVAAAISTSAQPSLPARPGLNSCTGFVINDGQVGSSLGSSYSSYTGYGGGIGGSYGGLGGSYGGLGGSYGGLGGYGSSYGGYGGGMGVNRFGGYGSMYLVKNLSGLQLYPSLYTR